MGVKPCEARFIFVGLNSWEVGTKLGGPLGTKLGAPLGTKTGALGAPPGTNIGALVTASLEKLLLKAFIDDVSGAGYFLTYCC